MRLKDQGSSSGQKDQGSSSGLWGLRAPERSGQQLRALGPLCVQQFCTRWWRGSSNSEGTPARTAWQVTHTEPHQQLAVARCEVVRTLGERVLVPGAIG